MAVANGGGGIGRDLGESGGGSISSITQTMAITDGWGGIGRDLGDCWGGNNSGSGIGRDLSDRWGGNNSGGGSGVAESVSVTQSGGGSGIAESVSVSTVMRRGVADLRHVGNGGGGDGCDSGSGGVAKAVAVPAVAEPENSAFLCFLIRVFSADAGGDSQKDASLEEMETLCRTCLNLIHSCPMPRRIFGPKVEEISGRRMDRKF
jgi:hypothetical protein